MIPLARARRNGPHCVGLVAYIYLFPTPRRVDSALSRQQEYLNALGFNDNLISSDTRGRRSHQLRDFVPRQPIGERVYHDTVIHAVGSQHLHHALCTTLAWRLSIVDTASASCKRYDLSRSAGLFFCRSVEVILSLTNSSIRGQRGSKQPYSEFDSNIF